MQRIKLVLHVRWSVRKTITLDKQGVVIDMPTWDACWLGSETEYCFYLGDGVWTVGFDH
jgi:hypothetical protein